MLVKLLSFAERRPVPENIGHDRRLDCAGMRKNVFDLCRAAAIQNLETIHRCKLAA
jgi:hypothetical protein